MTGTDTPPESVVKAALDSGDYLRAAPLLTMLRLHWFTRLRWAFLAAAIIVLAAEWSVVSGRGRPLLGLAVVLGALGCVNLGWMAVSHVLFRRFREDAPFPTGPWSPVVIFANGQVAADLFLLSCILRFTGGAESPLAMFYLFHMAIVSLLLERWQAILHGTWALLLYAALVIGEWLGWLTPHYSFLPNHPIGLHNEPEYVLAALFVVACGIFGTLYFALQIAGRLQRRELKLRDANVALHRSQMAIQELQRRRSRFMQTAAHQLKSPLAAIQTLAELIRGNVVPPEETARTCDKIVRRCADGISQVSELITLARVQEADPARQGVSEADVREVVAELCARFDPVARAKDVNLTCHVPESGALTASVDRQDLSDCIGNLVDNAIKYTPGPGRVTVAVAVEPARGPSQEISFTVSDTGMGINPELLACEDGVPSHAPLFDAFRRGNNALAASIPGTGLGLSIVREVVERAGGRIRVTSRPNDGSSFTVTLPAPGGTAGRSQAPNTRSSAIVPESNEPHQGGPTSTG